VLGRTYPVHSLPDDDILRADLAQVCLLLQEAVRAKHQLAVVDPGSISTASAVPQLPPTREYIFNPETDKKTSIAPRRRSIERTPRHEGGLRRYGEWLIGRGFKVATNVHPRDFSSKDRRSGLANIRSCMARTWHEPPARRTASSRNIDTFSIRSAPDAAVGGVQRSRA
jgi:hypothetical protein